MSNYPGTFDALASELARVLAPLREYLQPEAATALLWDMGLRAPAALLGAAPVAQAMAAGATAADTLGDDLRSLLDAIDRGDAIAIAAGGAQVLASIRALVTAVRSTGTAVDSVKATLGLTAAQRAELATFAGNFAGNLLQQLLVEHFERRMPQLASALMLAGVIEITEVAGGAATSLNAAYTRRAFSLARALKLFSDPMGLLRETYHWGQGDFDGLALLRTIKTIAERGFDQEVEVLTPSGLPASLEALGFSLHVNNAVTPPGLDLSLRFPADITVAESFADGSWTMPVQARARFATDLDVTLRAPLAIQLATPNATAELKLVAEARRAESAETALVFGSAGGTRLEAKALGGAVSLDARWDVGSGQVVVDPQISAYLKNARFVLGADGDSLLGELLGNRTVEARFDVDASWSPQRGLRLGGGAAIAIDIPTRASLGPVRVDTLHVGVGLVDAALRFDLAATLGAKLGPITATVERIGLRGTITAPSSGGNLGPIDLQLGFKPPTGIGLSMDTPTAKLGGFLSFNPDQGRYLGALELRLLDKLDLSAVGVLDTRMPNGGSGFSLLVLIGTTFPSPIPLGYNLYLSGVGGILGLHRSVDIDRIRRGLRDGVVDRLLFPTDVVAHMSALVTDLTQVFPVKRDQFVIGPTAKLTWNTPPLITAEVGLVLELSHPTRVALLGVMRAAVPRASEALIDLKVAFLGTIDLDAGLLAFDASLYDSYIGRGSFKYRFDGDLALRTSWGSKKDFLVSVGGFHPSYRPPAYLQVPAMRRLTISLLKDNPKLTLTAYAALTTNTAQFGAELDFQFSVSRFKVVGTFGFDALFQFSPFAFSAAVRARLAVMAGSHTLFSVGLDFELSGTTPWRAKGSASFKICWFLTIKVRFDKTWGEKRDIAVPAIAVLPPVIAELQKAANWSAVMSSGASALVRLTPAASSADAAILDPAGVLTIRQNIAPLATELARFGNAVPSDVKKIDITAVKVGTRSLTLDNATDEFAPASFRDMSDRDKLQAASYESRKAGVSARSAAGMTTTYALGRILGYERVVSDASGANPAPPRKLLKVRQDVFEQLVPGGAIGRSPLSRQRARAGQKVKNVVAGDERFAVVTASTLQAADTTSAGLSRADAEAKLRTLRAAGLDVDLVPDYQRAA